MDKPKIFTKNRYGISVIKCCASCAHKLCDSRVRFCNAGEGPVPPDFLCSSWKLSEGLDNAGKGGGQVKTMEYLQYAVNAIAEESRLAYIASASRAIYKRKGIIEIRQDFEKEHGDIFMKI